MAEGVATAGGLTLGGAGTGGAAGGDLGCGGDYEGTFLIEEHTFYLSMR
jgi:hypothetical protein